MVYNVASANSCSCPWWIDWPMLCLIFFSAQVQKQLSKLVLVNPGLVCGLILLIFLVRATFDVCESFFPNPSMLLLFTLSQVFQFQYAYILFSFNHASIWICHYCQVSFCLLRSFSLPSILNLKGISVQALFHLRKYMLTAEASLYFIDPSHLLTDVSSSFCYFVKYIENYKTGPLWYLFLSTLDGTFIIFSVHYMLPPVILYLEFSKNQYSN